MARKALVFDIGNVLVNWDPDQLYGPLLDEETRAALLAEADLMAMNEAIDKGAPFRETVFATADAHPRHAKLIRLWHDRWAEMFTPAIDGSWKILRTARAAGIPCFALSNFGSESFDYAETLYPGLKEFDARFISGKMGVIKPDPEIYRRLEEETGFAGGELFFIDDRDDNIAAARARGWGGHVFTTPEQLLPDIVAEFGLHVVL